MDSTEGTIREAVTRDELVKALRETADLLESTVSDREADAVVLSLVFGVLVHEDKVPDGWLGNVNCIVRGGNPLVRFLLKELNQVQAEYHV